MAATGATFALIGACSTFSTTPSAADAAPAIDATVDAPTIEEDAGDAAPERFCDAYPDAAFCWSFDEGFDPRTGPQLTLAGDASPSLDAGYSRPNALAIDLDGPLDIAKYAFSYVTLDPPKNGNHVHCDLVISADQLVPDASVTANLDVVLVTTPSQRLEVALKVGDTPDSLVLWEGVSSDIAKVGNLAPDAWTKIGFDVAVDGGEAYVTGSVGGVIATNSVGTRTDASTANLGAYSLAFGATFTRAHWRLLVDDIVCNFDP